MKFIVILIGIVVSFSSSNLFAQGAPVPHIFVQGNPVISSEFNANFQDLSNRNDTTQTQVDQNTTDITSVQSSISTIQSDITNLQATPGNPQLQFVGNSAGTVDGSNGIRAMTELCQVDFVDSRICTTEEYAKTISFPAPISATTSAWILPSHLVGSGNNDAGVIPLTELYSGVSQSNSGGGVNFNCAGWSSTWSSGLIVSGVGRLLGGSCNELRPVSCCK